MISRAHIVVNKIKMATNRGEQKNVQEKKEDSEYVLQIQTRFRGDLRSSWDLSR